MSIFLSFYSGLITVFPAAAFWVFISRSAGCEYYWKSYFLVCGVFLAASFAFGFIPPALIPKKWLHHPSLWFFGQGCLAWFVAIFALGMVNLSPLCIGQDNGDGNNDIALCVVQTVMVALVFSPLEFILLCLMALPGGWLIKRIAKGWAK
jgi:hypothetical protein